MVSKQGSLKNILFVNDREHRRTLAADLAPALKSLPPKTKSVLKPAFAKVKQINGYRSPLDAGVLALKTAIEGWLVPPSAFGDLLLTLWGDRAQSQLAAEVKAALAGMELTDETWAQAALQAREKLPQHTSEHIDLAVAYLLNNPPENAGTTVSTTFPAADDGRAGAGATDLQSIGNPTVVDSECANQPDDESDAVMIYKRARPARQHKIGGEKMPADSILHRWLDELAAIPPTEPLWDLIPAFVQAVQAITEQKSADGQVAAERQALDHQLAAVRADAALIPTLPTQCAYWTASSCPPERLSTTGALLEQFRELLSEYRRIESRTVVSMAEAGEQRRALADVVERIVSSHDGLDRLLRNSNADASSVASPVEELPPSDAAPPNSATTFVSPPGRPADNAATSVEPLDFDAVPDEGLTNEITEAAATWEVVSEPADLPPASTNPISEASYPTALTTDGATATDRAEREEPDRPTSTRTDEPASTLPDDVTGRVDDLAAGIETPPPPSEEEPTEAPQSAVMATEVDEPVRPAESTPPPSDGFLWTMLAANDPPGAYWYVRAEEEQGRAASVPSQVIAALAGAHWLLAGADEVESDLAGIFQRPRPADAIGAALGAAAALGPALRAPATGAVAWLDDLPQPSDVLNPVLRAVREFAEMRMPLTPADIRGQRDIASLDDRLRRQVAETRRWLDAAQRRVKFGTDVLRSMCASGGQLPELLDAVVTDRRSAAGELAIQLARWRDRRTIATAIQSQQRDLHRNSKFRAIEGHALNQLIGDLEEVISQADQWCRLAEEWRTATADQAALHARIADLSQSLDRMIPEALRALPGAGEESQPLRRVLSEIQTLLRGDSPAEETRPAVHRDLPGILAAHMTHYPGIPLAVTVDGQPYIADDGWPAVSQHLADDWPAPTAEQALTGWLEREDFRFIDDLIGELPEEKQAEWASRAELARRDVRAALQGEVEAAEQELEAGFSEGTIDSAGRSQLAAELEAVRAEVAASSVAFVTVRRHLRSVRSAMADQRDAPVRSFRQRWDTTRVRLLAFAPDLVLERASSLMAVALESRDQTLLNEALPALESASTSPELERALAQLAPGAGDGLSSPDFLAEFQAVRARLLKLPETEGWLRDLEASLRSGSTPEDLSAEPLSPAQSSEVAEALLGWQTMKGLGRSGATLIETTTRSEVNSLHLWRLMRLLGFQMASGGRELFTPVQTGRGWARWQAKMTATTANTVPQFGSGRADVHQLLLLWERPGLTALDRIYREGGLHRTDPLIVVYLGRVTERGWQDFTRAAYRSRQQALLLDELLLLYLAGVRANRLDAFFACTLPASHVNPYFPYAAGSLPEEMFVGRLAMRDDLRNQHGPALVYGGRQLGKSSLLQQVAREFHNPDAKRFARVIDIRNVGDEGTPAAAAGIWDRIAEQFSSMDLPQGLRPRTANEKPQTVLNRLRDAQIQLLLLLDEADMFLTADREHNFKVVSDLKRIMDESQRRIKFVFAGLHNVRRYASVPNQPFAHLGSPITVGPLDPSDARVLIERLRLLGFQLDDHVVLKILGLTNYHPALVQLLCYRLVEGLRTDPLRLPPYPISLDDVERVMSDPKLRSDFRDRFLWTLDLDPHYGVLTRAIVERQLASAGPAQTFTMADLRALGEHWWEDGFVSLTPDHFRAYIEELADLGVLAPLSNGSYQLRSPNLARLLGNQDELTDFLCQTDQLPLDPLEERRTTREHRRSSTGESPRLYSPLSQGQLDRLGLQRAGVTIVLGTKATGIDALPAWLSALAKSGQTLSFRYLQRDQPLVASSALSQARTVRAEFGDAACPVLSFPLQGDLDSLRSQVQAAFSVSERLGRAGGRVLLLGDAATLTSWLNLPPEEREDLEARTGCTVLERWRRIAINSLLEELNASHRPAAVTRLLALTGGYHPLVVAFIQHHTATGHVEKAIDALAGELALHDSPLANDIRRSLQLPTAGAARDLLDAICVYAGDNPADGVDADVLQDLLSSRSGEEVDRAIVLLERFGLIDRRERTIIAAPHVCLVEASQ